MRTQGCFSPIPKVRCKNSELDFKRILTLIFSLKIFSYLAETIIPKNFQMTTIHDFPVADSFKMRILLFIPQLLAKVAILILVKYYSTTVAHCLKSSVSQ